MTIRQFLLEYICNVSTTPPPPDRLRRRSRSSVFDLFPKAAWIPRDPPPSPPQNKRVKQGVPPPSSDEVRPIEAESCTPEEARTKLDEFFKHYEKGGGGDLRVELVRGLPGIRFTLVGSWDDMS